MTEFVARRDGSLAEPARQPVERLGASRASAALDWHLCARAGCGAFGAFGHGVRQRKGQRGTWYCRAHDPQGGCGTPPEEVRLLAAAEAPPADLFAASRRGPRG